MSENSLEAEVEGARAYEQLFVPAVFRQWPKHVLDAAGVGRGDRVLDVACGTGVLAREAAERVGDTGLVAGLDVSQGMLAVARHLEPGIYWRLGSAESLPFAEDSFDAVVSQFGLMFFEDRLKAIREMVRVVVPGGKLAFAVWDSIDRIPAVEREVEIIEGKVGAEAGAALRAPFVFGDTGTLKQLADGAGLDSVEITTHTGEAHFPSIRSLVEADLRGWLPLMGVAVSEEDIEEILATADRELGDYVKDKQMVFDLPAHIVQGSKGQIAQRQ